MSGTPIRRERRERKLEKDLLNGRDTVPIEVVEVAVTERDLSPTRREKNVHPAEKYSQKDVMDRMLEKLEPRALKVLARQLDSRDERVAQSAAIKLLEWKRGKPSQQVKVDNNTVHTIKYETIAFDHGGRGLPPPSVELEAADVIEEDDEHDSGE